MNNDKCTTCMTRYVCNNEYEWECKENNYRYYFEDKQKIKELEKEKQHNDRT